MTGATILGGIAGPDLTAAERDFFRSADPWGFILFGRNIDTPERLRRLTADLRAAVGRDAPVLIDQEGGRVQRMRAPHWTDWPAPLDQAANGDRAIWLHHHLLAQELRDMGIDADCARILFDNLALLARDGDAMRTRQAVQEFNRAVLAALDGLPEGPVA